MGLLDDLSTYRVVFYFFERDQIAYEGSWELLAKIAERFKPGAALAELPDILPVWQGSYLPHQAAFDRWGIVDVWAVSVGCPSAAARRELTAHIRAVGALGLFDVDAGPQIPDLPLILTGFLLPDAYLRFAASGFRRSLDRATGLDVLAPPSEEEGWVFDLPTELMPDDFFERSLLRLLSRTQGRRLEPTGSADGYDALLDQAFDLFHLRANGAAGAVAGVAFEVLMKAALVGPDRQWLQDRVATGAHVALNDVIAKVAARRGIDEARFRRYQNLRNDFAHQLGDDTAADVPNHGVRERVEEMLRWCDAQSVDEHGIAQLVDVAEEPALTPAELFEDARALANEAAARARTTPMRIAGTNIEPQGFAWVVVRSRHSAFAEWLIASGHGSPTEGGVTIRAPDLALERNLSWAVALGKRLRRAGISVTYGGRAD